MCFIATINDKAATKNWATHVETVEGANVASGLANGCAQPAKGARHIVELTVESD
jgi:hypothetical protein